MPHPLLVLGALSGGAYLIKKLFEDDAPAPAEPVPAFVSFDFDHDLDAKMLLVGQARNAKTPFAIVDHSARSSMPKRRWVEIVRGRIARCDVVMVLVGQTMASARGVHREIALARELGKPVFGVYVNGAGARSRLPKGLRREDVIDWSWDELARRLRGSAT